MIDEKCFFHNYFKAAGLHACDLQEIASNDERDFQCEKCPFNCSRAYGVGIVKEYMENNLRAGMFD